MKIKYLISDNLWIILAVFAVLGLGNWAIKELRSQPPQMNQTE